jgi:hypothetical protein
MNDFSIPSLRGRGPEPQSAIGDSQSYSVFVPLAVPAIGVTTTFRNHTTS